MVQWCVFLCGLLFLYGVVIDITATWSSVVVLFFDVEYQCFVFVLVLAK